MRRIVADHGEPIGGADDLRTKDFVLTGRTPVLEKPLDMNQVRALVAQMLSQS